jgi:hypothetical protein
MDNINFMRSTPKQGKMEKHTDTAEYWKAKFIQQNQDLFCESMDPNGTIWDHAKRLQDENKRLAEALESIVEYWNRAQNTSAMVDALEHNIETAEEALQIREKV